MDDPMIQGLAAKDFQSGNINSMLKKLQDQFVTVGTQLSTW